MSFRFTKLLQAIRAGYSGPTIPSMYLNLSNAVNATIADAQGNGTITSVAGGVININVSPSRTTGVAPLYVNFDMTGTTSSASSNPTHELLFVTDFGDSGAGNWAQGVQSAGLTSKNIGYGPITGHVYETPGTFHPSTMAIDGTNPSGVMGGVITVLDPEVVFNAPYGDTYYLSTSGTFTGALGSLNRITVGTSDMFTLINSYKASNRRILFCKADNWTCSAQIVLSNLTNMTIDGYGPGGDARAFGSGTLVRLTPDDFGWPTVKGRSIFSTGVGITDLKICNIKIAGGNSHSAGGIGEACNGILFSKMEIRGAYAGWNSGASTGNLPYIYEQLCFYECLVDNLFGKPFIDYPTGENYVGGVGIYATLRHGGIMGCYLDSCSHGEQVVRIPDAYCGHINNNFLARPNQSKNTLKINGVIHATFPIWTEKMVIGGNFLTLRGGYSYQAALGYTSAAGGTNSATVTQTEGTLIGCGNGGNGDVGGEWIRNVIIENNYAEGCLGNPKGAHQFAWIGAPNVTMRNNIVDFSVDINGNGRGVSQAGTYIYTQVCFADVTTSTADKTTGVRIYNNTLYSNLSNAEHAVMVTISAPGGANLQPDAVTVKNNLLHLPFHASSYYRATVYQYVGAAATALTVDHNTDEVSAVTASPNFSAFPPVALADWRPTSGYAINSGTTVPVLRDINQASRSGGAYDLGAVLP